MMRLCSMKPSCLDNWLLWADSLRKMSWKISFEAEIHTSMQRFQLVLVLGTIVRDGCTMSVKAGLLLNNAKICSRREATWITKESPSTLYPILLLKRRRFWVDHPRTLFFRTLRFDQNWLLRYLLLELAISIKSREALEKQSNRITLEHKQYSSNPPVDSFYLTLSLR